MSISRPIPLKLRMVAFTALWIIAGLTCAVFSNLGIYAGDSEFFACFEILYLAPLFAAVSTSFAFLHNRFSDVGTDVLLVAFAIHAVVMLTRKTRWQFLVCCAIQLVFLTITTICVLYFFNYQATHGHG